MYKIDKKRGVALLFFLFLSQLSASQSHWKHLKALKTYAPEAYSLKKGIHYLEIRRYYKPIEAKAYDTKNSTVTVVMQQKGFMLSSDKTIARRFKQALPTFAKETNLKPHGLCIMSGCAGYISNAFMIDSKGKIWRMNEVQDVMNMLERVKTPADLKLVLWLQHPNWDLTDENHQEKYRKTATGYTVIAQYENSIMNKGECGHFTYRLTVDHQGKIGSKKLLKKEPSKEGCLAVD